MREIKFRVRDGASKKVLGFEHFNTSLNNGYYYIDLRNPVDDGEGGETYICKTEFSEQPMLKPEHPMSRLLREQYTGLKDKNGVEIYEGDILEFDWRLQATNELYGDDCENIKGEVKFSFGKFIISCFGGGIQFDASDINQTTFERFWRETYPLSKDGYYKMTGFKIIGNIYENKEPLGE